MSASAASADNRNAFYGTYVRDWIALCDGMRDADVRGYLILRSLVFEGKGVKNRVRVLTPADLCELIPGPNGKPSSLSRVRELLRRLSAVGLVTTPEGGPVTTSSSAKAQDRPLRIKIHDQPANGFEPAWPNTEEKLASVRPATGRTAAAGQGSGRDDAGWNSDQPGWNSNRFGQNSNQEPGTDLGKRAPYCSSFRSASSTAGGSVADAVGKNAGGFARESDRAEGGSAACDTPNIPAQRKATQSPRPATVKTRPRQEAPGFDMVRAAIPIAVARPGTRLYPHLHRAINDLLLANPAAGVPRRTPEQVIARINRRWYGENAEERAAADYRGCDRCTASGCDAPRRSEANPYGCDRIKNRCAWLMEAILAQDCPDPRCEDGEIIGSGEPCRDCQGRRADEHRARQAVAGARARLEAETEALEAARAVADEWEAARAAEEHRIRTRLGRAGVWGVKLDHHIAQHMSGWRDRNPKPTGNPLPPAHQERRDHRTPGAER